MAESGIIPKASAQAIWDGGKKAMEALKVDPAGNVEKIDEFLADDEFTALFDMRQPPHHPAGVR